MSTQKTRVAGHMAAIFTMLIWGTTFISTKVLLESLSPLEILVLRFVAGYIFLWLIRPVPLKLKSVKEELIMVVAGRHLLSSGKYCPHHDSGFQCQCYRICCTDFYRDHGPLFLRRGEDEEKHCGRFYLCHVGNLPDHFPER